MAGAAYIDVRINDIHVGGTVQHVDVEDHDRLLDRARIVLDDPSEFQGHALLEGQRVQIDMGWSGEHATLFEGVVTRAVTEASAAGHRVTVTALDLGYLLNQGEPPAPTAHEGSLSDILRRLVTRRPCGIEVGQIEPEPDRRFAAPEPLIQQAGVRDWDFIQRLAVEHGCRAFVEHNEGTSRFYFVPEERMLRAEPMGTLTWRRGQGPLIGFRYQRVASAAAPQPSFAVVDPRTGATARAEAPAGEPMAPAAPSAAARARLGSGAALYDDVMDAAASASGTPDDQAPRPFVAGLPSDPALAERLARRDPTRLHGMVGEGVAIGNVNLRAKGRIGIAGIAPWAEGDWYVTRVNHVFTRMATAPGLPTYTTRFAATR